MYLQALQKLGESLGWHTPVQGFERFVLSFTLLIFLVYYSTYLWQSELPVPNTMPERNVFDYCYFALYIKVGGRIPSSSSLYFSISIFL